MYVQLDLSLCFWKIMGFPRTPPISLHLWLPAYSVMSDSLPAHALWPARLLCVWNFPGKNTGVGCRFLLQGTFPTQGLNPALLPLDFFLLTEPPVKPKNFYGTMVKNLPANADDLRDAGSIPGSGRGPGVRNDSPLQYSCLENSMNRGA